MLNLQGHQVQSHFTQAVGTWLLGVAGAVKTFGWLDKFWQSARHMAAASYDC
jgi:hypothetical protein